MIGIEQFSVDRDTIIKAKESPEILNSLCITAEKETGGVVTPLSSYGDDRWILPSHKVSSGRNPNAMTLDFTGLKNQAFVAPLKLAMARYYFKGRPGYRVPSGSSVVKTFRHLRVFLNYLTDNGISSLKNINALVGSQYARHCETSERNGKKNKPLSIAQRLIPVTALHELLSDTEYAFNHPWPESSANAMAGWESNPNKAGDTLIIPSSIVAQIMKSSVKALNESSDLIATGKERDLLRLRDSCALIILLTTGIRANELLSIEVDSIYKTMNSHGEMMHWIKGVSAKTHTGKTEWLCPEICHQAIKALEKTSEKERSKVVERLQEAVKRKDNKEIKRLDSIKNSIFVEKRTKYKITTGVLCYRLKKYVKSIGSNWNFTPHQARRTFAVYVVKNSLGDLRYLRDHFKHWTLDMTAMYSANAKQDLELFNEIYTSMRGEKTTIVEHWLDPETPLAGGLSNKLKVFRSKNEEVRTYDNYREMVSGISNNISLRATGVAWCTADEFNCSGGKSIEKTRCGDCANSVIDDSHKHLWKAIYNQQIELINLDDIGEAGRDSAQRALERCKQVLTELGANPSDLTR